MMLGISNISAYHGQPPNFGYLLLSNINVHKIAVKVGNLCTLITITDNSYDDNYAFSTDR